jgi:hypothetical protein
MTHIRNLRTATGFIMVLISLSSLCNVTSSKEGWTVFFVLLIGVLMMAGEA